MLNHKRFLKYLALSIPVALCVPLAIWGSGVMKITPYSPENTISILEADLKAGQKIGNPIFIRIFKASSELEIWIENDAKQYTHFKTYPICYFSGKLGPKLKEGDKQAPEGFYTVSPKQMNPNSRYHLSFNLGFPNAYDQAHGRTGSFLMVHGSCVSVGCFAMTDILMEEIYTLADKAHAHGQDAFSVHIFPFHMTEENMQKYNDHQWYSFWQNLKEGYDYFDNLRIVPNIITDQKKYILKYPHR